MIDKQAALMGYVECALWSSTDDQGEPLDDNYFPTDISEPTQAAMREELFDFIDANADALERSSLDSSQIGHDFWLTRNGHGAGFWDRGLGQLGDELTAAAKVYRGVDLYVGDDGRVWA